MRQFVLVCHTFTLYCFSFKYSKTKQGDTKIYYDRDAVCVKCKKKNELSVFLHTLFSFDLDGSVAGNIFTKIIPSVEGPSMVLSQNATSSVILFIFLTAT